MSEVFGAAEKLSEQDQRLADLYADFGIPFDRLVSSDLVDRFCAVLHAKGDDRSKQEIVTRLASLRKARSLPKVAPDAQLSEVLDQLDTQRNVGTTVFFDLVGSTEFRRQYGPEKCLKKAYEHNVIVSREIVEYGGEVVKWLGDGVMGYFQEAQCGPKHAFHALRVALSTLASLDDRNRGQSWQDEIHTKIGISTGAVYAETESAFDPEVSGGPNIENALSANHPLSVLGVMGTAVDIAARLNSLAEMDVILVDAGSFWGDEIDGMCNVTREQIAWRELLSDVARETVYVPKAAAFFVEDDELRLSHVTRHASEPINIDVFHQLVKEESQDTQHGSRYVFVSSPVSCNIPGFELPIEAVAVSLTPRSAPIKHMQYASTDPRTERLVAEAEKALRQGSTEAAIQGFQEVLEADPRHFQANVRLAMLYRGGGDTTRSMEHLMRAKQSNAATALVWAVAAITHLEDYLYDRGDKNVCLSRAITGFTRAKALASEQFDGLMEQYCTCLLAIAHLLRGAMEDTSMATSLLDDLETWPDKNNAVTTLRRLAHVFRLLSDDGNLEDARRELEFARSTVISGEGYFDELISPKDVQLLMAKADFLVRVLE